MKYLRPLFALSALLTSVAACEEDDPRYPEPELGVDIATEDDTTEDKDAADGAEDVVEIDVTDPETDVTDAEADVAAPLCTGAAACDDGNPCTTDDCDPATGCTFAPNTAACSDGDACTEGDVCADGVCQSGQPACLCTTNADCADNDDGDPCTGTLVCDLAADPPVCAVDPKTVPTCDASDDTECMKSTCQPATGACEPTPTNEDGDCDDGDACTTDDTCADGECEGGAAAVCNDGDPCTDDSCDPATGCETTPSTAACDDGDACTTGDTCNGGACQGGGVLVCDDGNPCTAEECVSASGCVPTNVAGSCDDGNACTTGDACDAGVCKSGAALFCDDGKVCTTDTCDTEDGCAFTNNTESCTDGDACTTADTCDAGACKGGPALVCDDGNLCTDDACEAAIGCTTTNNTTGCDDGNACTTADTCDAGACKGGAELPCDDGKVCTDDSCDQDSGCVTTDNTAACDDDSACTTIDTCDAGACKGGAAPVCDDGNLCTADSCDPGLGCVTTNLTIPCDDGDPCTVADACDAAACSGAPALTEPPTLTLTTDSGVPGDGRTNVPGVQVGFATCGTWALQIDGGPFVAGVGASFDLLLGTHTYAVQRTNSQGAIVSGGAPITFIYDTESAALSLVLTDSNGQLVETDPANAAAVPVTNDPGAYIAIVGLEPGATWSYLVDLEGEWIPGSGAELPLTEGLHGYVVRQIDVAGNQSIAGGEFYAISADIAPLTVQLAEDTGIVGDGITFNPQVLISGLKSGATWEYRIDGQPLWTQGSGDSFLLHPETHTYTVRQSDDAGNTATSEPVEFTYRGEAATPLLRLVVDAGPGEDGRLVDGITNAPAVQVYFLEPGATWEYQVDGGAWIQGSGDGFDILQDGQPHTYAVRQVSAAGKPSLESAEAVFTFDETPPAPVTFGLVSDSGAPSDGITNVPEIQVVGLEDGDVFEYRIDDGEWVTWQGDIIPMDPGKHTYAVRRYDTAGNPSDVTALELTYLSPNTVAPSLSLANDTGATPGDGVTTDDQIEFVPSGDDPDATWEYRVDGGPWQTGTGGAFTAEPGSHTYEVRQVDAAGNASPTSNPVTVFLSLGSPTFTSGTDAVIDDPDSEGLFAISAATVLYTATATDPDGGDVRFALSPNEQFTIDAETGALRFAQPTGFTVAGPNTRLVTIVARNTAGSEASLTVTVRVLRTNTSAPKIDLGEVKKGVLSLGTFDSSVLLPGGATLAGVAGAFKRLDPQGQVDASFPTITSSTYPKVAVDGQGRLYVVSGAFSNALPVKRYLANGTLDTTYAGGTVSLAPNPGNDAWTMFDFAARSDGTLYVVGRQADVGGTTITGDSAFGVVTASGGISTNLRNNFSPNAGDFNQRVMLGLDPSHVFVQNRYAPSGTFPTASRIHRYVNNALDSSYASGGTLAIAADPRGMWTDRQGRLVVLSATGALSRYSANGVLDSGFAASNPPSFGENTEAVFAADGGAWYLTPNNSTGAVVRRLLPTGAVDTTFAGTGTFTMTALPTTTGGPAFALDEAGESLLYLGRYFDTEFSKQITTITRFSTAGVLDTRYGDVALTITEGNRAIAMLTTAASIIDSDSAATNYGGATVTIEREGGADSADLFSGRGLLRLDDQGQVVWDGEVVGTFTRANGRLELHFGETASHPDFDGVLRALTYYCNSQQPAPRVRLVWTVNDNDPIGAKSTTAVQTINVVNDRADVGDPTLQTTLNGQATTLSKYTKVGDKHYYVHPPSFHDTLDTRFNSGEDTTDLARSVTPADGNTYILLSQSELAALFAQPDLPAALTPAGLGYRVWTATRGTDPDSHVRFSFVSFDTADDLDDMNSAVVEVLPSPFTPTGPVDPRFQLVEDNGASFTDNLTSNGRLTIIGFEQALPFETSLNGGATWTALPAGSELSVLLPAGVHPSGTVKARQTDQTGFQTEIASTITYNIDPTIRSIQLLNDQGVSRGDSMTADGRVIILNFEPASPFEYSIDNGQTWQNGGALAGGLGFVLPNGVYPVGHVRVRQDIGGFVSGANNNTKYVVDPILGQGTIRLAIDTGSSATDGLTSDSRVNVTGLLPSLAWEYSTNGGSAWQAGAAASGPTQSFSLPDGIHPTGDVRVRQTDAAGFVTTIATTMAFNIDKTVRSLSLLNDTGTSRVDGITADGRMLAVNFDPMVAFEYSVNSGQSWLPGGPLGDKLGFTLPNGTYLPGAVRVRQTISAFTTEASFSFRVTVDPAQGQGVIDLATDAGTSPSDGLTSDPKATVTGLVPERAFEYSVDAGANWLSGSPIAYPIQSFTLPEGSYATGAVRVRQTDAAGFQLTLSSKAAYQIDRSIGQATIALLNDTGISNTDLTSADGSVRVSLTGVSAGDSWAYTLDNGVTWTPGVGATGADFVLSNGSYTARQVRVRLNDAAGNQAIAEFDKAFRIDNTDATGPVFTSGADAVVLDQDGPGAQKVPTTRTLHTPAVTDANLVVFSLSGAGAADFQIDPVTGKLAFSAATGFAQAGPNTRTVTIVATDLFGNASSKAVSVRIAAPPSLVSTSPASLGTMGPAGSISFTFDQPIQAGTGAITLFDTRAFVEYTFDATDASQVSVSGNVMTLQPSTPLPSDASLLVFVGYGSAKSLDGYDFGGSDVIYITITSGVLLNTTAVIGLPGETKWVLAPADQSQSDYDSDVHPAGDVNGDGKNDLIVAIPKADPGGRANAGRIYVVFGTTSTAQASLADVAAGTGGFIIDGLAAGDLLGTAVAGIGDFNGDGKGDLALGSPEAKGGLGEAFVVYGKATTSPVDLNSVRAGQGGFVITGEDAVRNFDKVSAIGDFNGDGKADVAFASTEAIQTFVTVESYDEVKEWTTTRTWQTVDVKTVTTTEPVTVVNPFSVYSLFDDPLEFAIENASDLFTDPKSTVTEDVGLRETTTTTTTTYTWTETTYWRQTTTYTTTWTRTSPAAGLVYVLFGGRPAADYQNLTPSKLAKPFSTLGFSITGIDASQYMGETMAPLGDVNNDGRDDFFLGGYVWGAKFTPMFVVLGTSYVSPGNKTVGDLTNLDGGYRLMDSSLLDAGSAAAPLGDWNGDGYDDFALGCNNGPILVIHGRQSSNEIDLATVKAGNGGFEIRRNGDAKLKKLSGLGDINGDGRGELLITDNFRDGWVVYGKTGSTPIEMKTVDGGSGGFRLEANQGVIHGAGSAGDFNGDGLKDYAFMLTDSFGAPPFLWLIPGNVVGVQP